MGLAHLKRTITAGKRSLGTWGTCLVVAMAFVGAGSTHVEAAGRRPTFAPPTTAHARQNKAPDQPSPVHAQQLEDCRAGLTAPGVGLEERRRWARTLFSYGTPQARKLAADLLWSDSQPDVLRALCDTVRDRRKQSTNLHDAWLIDPLVQLLSAKDVRVRSAAAKAMSEFRQTEVIVKLGSLASNTERPIEARLAAVDALATNVHRREVVAELMRLLDTGGTEIAERVVTALSPAARGPTRDDLAWWQKWWSEKSQLSQEEWLSDQLAITDDRLQSLEQSFRREQIASKRRHKAVSERLVNFQRTVFAATSPEKQTSVLTTWLTDPLQEVKLTAVGIVASRIADEGRRPDEAVLQSLLELLRDDEPEIKREVLRVVQTLDAPAVLDTVLGQLEMDQDATTRHALLKALGKLNSPRAVPALVSEIASPDTPQSCVREAAIALGRVAGKLDDDQHRRQAVDALKKTYANAKTDDVPLRAALLSAMAGLAEKSFTEEFIQAIEEDDPSVLRPSIRGLRTARDNSKLPRVRILMGHANSLVRAEAVESIGVFGSVDVDLETLPTRMNPATESESVVRESAWRSFKQLLSNRSTQDRIAAAHRLREMPDVEVRYLKELADALQDTRADLSDLETIYDRLTTIFLSQDQCPKAVQYLGRAFDLAATVHGKSNNQSTYHLRDMGLRWLRTALDCATTDDIASAFGRAAATAKDSVSRQLVVQTVADWAEEVEPTPNHAQPGEIVKALQAVEADQLGPSWPATLKELARTFAENAEGKHTPQSSK